MLHQRAERRDIVPLGTAKANFNYSLDEKRVLNMENVVNDADNVKQDMSIDVYGRKEDTKEEAAPPAAVRPQYTRIPPTPSSYTSLDCRLSCELQRLLNLGLHVVQ